MFAGLFTIPESNFLGTGNLIAAASEVLSGAIETGLGFIQTWGQKGVTACIKIATGIFDISSGIVSALEDSIDLFIESLIDEEVLEEFFYLYCDLSEIWSSFFEQWNEEEYSWDSLKAALAN